MNNSKKKLNIRHKKQSKININNKKNMQHFTNTNQNRKTLRSSSPSPPYYHRRRHNRHRNTLYVNNTPKLSYSNVNYNNRKYSDWYNPYYWWYLNSPYTTPNIISPMTDTENALQEKNNKLIQLQNKINQQETEKKVHMFMAKVVITGLIVGVIAYNLYKKK